MNLESVPHSPLGAGATFFFGPAGSPAGFEQTAGAGALEAQDVFVGCKPDQAEEWKLLPAFTARPGVLQPLGRGRYGRFLAWAGDKWMIGPLVFKLCTPFETESRNDDRFRCAPVVCGYLEYDNTHNDGAAELIFAVGRPAAPLRVSGAAGWALDARCGFATSASAEVVARSDIAAFGFDVGAVSALVFTVPPHAKRIFPLALGFFASELYASRYFADLASVLNYGLGEHARFVALADQRDSEFMRSSLSLDEKTRVSLETRRWLAGTRRLRNEPEIDLTPLRQLAASVLPSTGSSGS